MVQDCWEGDTIVSLPDLNTTETVVQDIWYAWVADLVANYSGETFFLPFPSQYPNFQSTDCVSIASLKSSRPSSLLTKVLLVSTALVRLTTVTQPWTVHIRTIWMEFSTTQCKSCTRFTSQLLCYTEILPPDIINSCTPSNLAAAASVISTT